MNERLLKKYNIAFDAIQSLQLAIDCMDKVDSIAILRKEYPEIIYKTFRDSLIYRFKYSLFREGFKANIIKESSDEDNELIGLDLTTTSRKIAASKQAQKTHKIDCVYQLGTPIDVKQYPPQMKVIKYLFNFYSRGDGIQKMAGFYKQHYPSHERTTNIELKITDLKKKKDYKPSHYGTHDPAVGSWILMVPFTLQEEKFGGFQNFEHGKECTVVFKKEDVPIYLPKK